MRKRITLFNIDSPSTDKDKIIKYFKDHPDATFDNQELMANEIKISQSAVSKFMTKHSNFEYIVGGESIIIGKLDNKYKRLSSNDISDECEYKIAQLNPFINTDVYKVNNDVYVYNIYENKADELTEILFDLYGEKHIFDIILNRQKLYIILNKGRTSKRESIINLPARIDKLRYTKKKIRTTDFL